VSAWILRVVIFLGPMAVGFLAGAMASRLMPEPSSAYQILTWWITVIAVATLAATGTDRVARKLLPLTVLLQMTMLFPDRAPSRLKMARRAGNPSELRRRIAEAERGGNTDTAEMAELILSLSAALSNHDRKTRGHSERTRAYTELLAEELGLAEGDRDRLRWAALLHDVGKLEVPADVLNKDTALTEEEWHQVRQHPIHGMSLVAPLIPWLGDWAKTIEHHHERWDGSGYPHGLSGTDIALGARIVSVADAYDVMTTGRSYQRAKTPAAAREEVAKMAGRQFDPTVARALMSVSLGKLRWSTGPLAVLAEIPFLRGLPQFGRDAATILASSAVMTTSLVIGAVPAPVDLRPTELVQVIIAGAGLTDELALPDTGSTGGGGRGSGAVPGTVAAEAPSGEQPADGTPTNGEAGDGPGETSTAGPQQPGADTTTTSLPEPGDPTTTTTIPATTTSSIGNSPPVARDDSAGVNEDSFVAVDVLANDSDPDGDLATSTLSVVAGPTLGGATVQSGRIRYTPAPNRSGTDRIEYRICDTAGACSTASLTVTIAPVNDPPSTPPLNVSTPAATLISSPLGYSDIDGDTLRCALATAPAVGAATVPTDCSRVSYQPPAGFAGEVAISIDVTDGRVTVRGAVTVTVIPGNRAPVTAPDSASTAAGVAVTISVLANDTDPDGDPVAIGSVGSPSIGTATVSGTQIVYTPPVTASGTATFSYSACDPYGLCAAGAVSVTIAPPPLVPQDDTLTVSAGKPGVINVTANDGAVDKATITIIDPPDHGEITDVGKSGNIRYQPEPGYTGSDAFVYRICNAAGSCGTATVWISVR
jgi:putative nucleotidyltransferase with HDIG domain